MKGKPRNRLSLIERAVLEAVMRCPRPQLRCLMRNVRKFYPRWGLDKEDITWGIKRLRASGILSGRFGKQGRSAILYRMANSRSAARRRARVLKGPSPRDARRLLKRYYRRRNPLRRHSYQIRFQKLVRREEKRLKQQRRHDRLARLRASKRRR